MAYNKDIPQASDILSISQGDILDNFTSLSNQLTLIEQLAAPTTLPNEGAIYTKEGPDPAETNLFFVGESNGTEYQLTTSILAEAATFGVNTGVGDSGWTFLPGGLILQYGRLVTSAVAGTITFPVVFPSGNPPFSITVGGEGVTRAGPLIIGAATDSTFDYLSQITSQVAINWIAIGK